MAVNSRRIRLILIIVVCVIIVISAVGFFVIPGVIESKANAMLEQAEAKTGRHIELSDLSLRGLKRVAVSRVTISDIDHPERIGVAADDVLISFSGFPVGDFSIASIRVDNLDITVRMSGGATNFEDILNKLRRKEEEVPQESKAAPAWKKYITPFPEIRVSEVSVTMPTIKLGKSVEIGAVSADEVEVSQSKKDGAYALSAGVSALLVENGTPTTYRSEVSGHILNTKEGSISITSPQSEKETVPEVMRRTSVAFEAIRLVLPTTIEIDGLSIAPDGKQLFSSEKTRARLMTLPPTKVAGVYLKEIEVVKPKVHDYMDSDGSLLVNWAKDAAAAIGLREETKKAIPQKIGEAAAEAAAAAAEAALRAAAEGSEDVGKAAADAALKNVAEQVKFNPRDYFFSQRMFISDGAVIMEDLNNGIASFSLKDIELEIGYRSIRKVLDYRFEFGVEEPVSTSIELSGQYDLPGEDLKGRLVIHPLKSGKSLKTIQAVVQEKNAKAAEPSMLMRMIPAVELDNAVFEATLDYHYNQKHSQLDLDSLLKVNNFVLRQDLISREPTTISGSLGASMTANFADRTFDLKNIDLKTSGADVHFGFKLDNVERPQKKGAKTALSDKYFSVFVDVPTQRMQSLFDAIPHSLRTELDGLSWRGTLGLKFSASGYLDSISNSQHKFEIVPSSDFEILEWPKDRNLWSLNTGFTYNVQDPNALTPHSIAIPPSIYPIEHGGVMTYQPRATADEIRSNYPEWVLFDDLNPWLVQLITTTEDGSFFSHQGFSPLQVKSALERNLNRQTFARGASTISMQLVKNLFFERSKTISRKFQEVLYTWLMESVIRIPKKRIMELYFNIIEFGPEIYGIEEAAKYYFGKRSIDLSLKESAYLMAIIPSPRRGAVHRSKEKLDSGLQKTMSFYIREMYRRKCDQAVLASKRARLAKQGKSMLFEPCCPPHDSLQLMIEGNTLSFYIPNPENPQEYQYRPDLYTPDGIPLVPRKEQNCGHNSDELEASESIFEPFQPANSLIP